MKCNGEFVVVRYYVVATLDVRNAFNSVNWAEIAPHNIWKVFVDSFLHGIEEGEKCYHITAGVPQRSILVPVLRNAAYDDELWLALPPGSASHTS